jgi:hypothetical protein
MKTAEEAAIELLQYFVDRVEAGTIRSKTTYRKYKSFLEAYNSTQPPTAQGDICTAPMGACPCQSNPIDEGCRDCHFLQQCPPPPVSEERIGELWDKYCDTDIEAPEWMFKEHFKAAIKELTNPE